MYNEAGYDLLMGINQKAISANCQANTSIINIYVRSGNEIILKVH